jgi:hypothetical protein
MPLLSLTGFSVQIFIARLRTNTTLRLWVLAVGAVVIAVACDRVNLTAPTGSTISVTVERSVLPLGGQTTVTAVVTESSGTPVHNGTYVTFQTTVGSFNPPEAQTSNGVARTTFLAGSNSGTATIHAFSGGARTGSGNSSSGGATIRIGAAAAAGTISMSASPTSVSQSGGTVAISALVFDEANNPLPGVNVQFATGTGSLNPTAATTDGSGVARTLLTTTQTSVVEAFAGSAKGNVRVEVSTAPSVTIDVSPASPVAGTPTAITVTTGSGNSSAPRQIQTLEVNFGDGTFETRSNVTGSAAFTHTYTREGGYTITARAVDVAGNTGVASRAVVVSAATLPTVTISANPNPVPASANGLTTFTVTGTSTGAPLRNVTVRNMTSGGEVIYSGTGGGTFAHRFGGTGTYTIEASATDAAGNTGTTTTVVVVQ